MKNLRVAITSGVYCVISRDGTSHSINFQGPVTAFNPGWEPLFVYDGFSPIYLLELRHINGECATWYLDAEMRRLGDAIKDLPVEARGSIQLKALKLFEDIWEMLLCDESQLSEREECWFEVNCKTRLDILEYYNDHLSQADVIINIDAIDELAASRYEVLRIFSPLQLSDSLAGDLVTSLLTGIKTGLIPWKSPVDGKTIFSNLSLLLDGETTFAYRLDDNGRRFYLITSSDHCEPLAMYVPEAKLSVGVGWRCNRLESLFRPGGRGSLTALFHQLLCSHGEQLPAYYLAPNRRMTGYIRGGFHFHIGVYVWSVLTGIDKIIKNTAIEDIPDFVMIAGGPDVEKFGAIEELFPELQSTVKKNFTDRQSLLDYIFSTNRCLFMVAALLVTASIRQRVLRVANQSSRLDEARKRYDALRIGGTPIILIGLRVENRTVVDLSTFIERLVWRLSQQWDDVAIVIDGHNAPEYGGTSTFPSAFEHLAIEPPINIERQILEHLQAACKGRNIQIVSTIGDPISTSLFWAQRAAFFIAIWGAGLAKYRWICNRPGLVITSKWNLWNRGDLHIYDTPRFIEKPEPMYFLPEKYVQDKEEASVMFQGIDQQVESNANFQVHTEPAVEHIAQVTEAHISANCEVMRVQSEITR